MTLGNDKASAFVATDVLGHQCFTDEKRVSRYKSFVKEGMRQRYPLLDRHHEHGKLGPSRRYVQECGP